MSCYLTKFLKINQKKEMEMEKSCYRHKVRKEVTLAPIKRFMHVQHLKLIKLELYYPANLLKLLK